MTDLRREALQHAAQVELELVKRAKDMLTAIQGAGRDPLRDALDLLALQLLGPVLMRIVGQDPTVGMPEILQIAATVDLAQLNYLMWSDPNHHD